ncbi:hypothetical protein TcYC6_0048720 [Trypanosoma cruzi]|nr:hypothetical protein TcYC6_0048720 [Trypanosoma cruzi]RNC56488.1 helicase-like protein [Trypanosoma cruzi]
MDAQVQVAFDSLVSCERAQEAERDSTEQFMKLGRNILQAFRLQLILASDPSIPLSRLSARLRKNSDRCDVNFFTFICTMHLRAKYAAQPDGITCSADGHQKTAKGLPAAYEGGRWQPHPFHHLPPVLTGVAQNRRHSIRSLELPDAMVEKGKGAYPPTTLECGMAIHRHPRFEAAARREQTRRLEKCGRRQRGSGECL